MALLMGFIVMQVDTLRGLSNDLGSELIPILVISQEMTQEVSVSLNSITEYINSRRPNILSEWEENYKKAQGTGESLLKHLDSGKALKNIRGNATSILNELSKLNSSMKGFSQAASFSQLHADLSKLGEGSMQLIIPLAEAQYKGEGALEILVALVHINRRMTLLWEATARKDMSSLDESWDALARRLDFKQQSASRDIRDILAQLEALKDRAIALEANNVAARAELKQSREYIYELLAEFNIEARALTRGTMERGDGASNFIFITIIVGLVLGLALTLVLLCLLLHTTVRPLNGIIAHFTRGAEKLTHTAGHLSQSSQILSQGVGENTAAVLEAINSLEEMLTLAKRNASHSSEAQDLMDQARVHVEQASEAMREISLAMEEIRISGEASREIIKTVQKIAFQTNILALNAAVESARAGEAGLGFAVVADEVRNLANNSSEAAKNTALLIAGIGGNISKGTLLVHNAENSFASMVATSEQMGGLIGEIAQASQSQAMDIQSIHQSIAMMDKVTQENAASAGETNSISTSLTGQAAFLNDSVSEMTRILQGTSKVRPARRNRDTISLPKTRERAIEDGSAPQSQTRGGFVEDRSAPQPKASTAKVEADDLIPMDEDF